MESEPIGRNAHGTLEPPGTDSRPGRSAREVLDHHLERRRTGDLEEDVRQNVRAVGLSQTAGLGGGQRDED